MSEAVELGLALTGQELPLTAETDAGLVAELATLGWDAQRLGAVRLERMTARQPWPFPVRVELVRRFGFARFHARLTALREVLGLSGRVAADPAPLRPLDRDEQRLVAERPPHWG